MITNVIMIICAVLLVLQWIMFVVMSVMTKSGVSLGKVQILVQTDSDPAKVLFRNVMIIAFVMFMVSKGIYLQP